MVTMTTPSILSSLHAMQEMDQSTLKALRIINANKEFFPFLHQRSQIEGKNKHEKSTLFAAP